VNAAELIALNVVTGLVTDRLSEVAFRISASRSHYCVVLDEAGANCLGLIRLADVAPWSHPGNRILGDLVGAITPMTVRLDESAADVALLFGKHALSEAVVVAKDGRYVGLITSESVLAWTLAELKLGRVSTEPPPPVADKIPAAVPVLRATPIATATADGAGRWILLVEDHEPSRSALAAILRKRDYQVLACGNIEEALANAGQQKFALVISDLELPDGSGFGLMKELRQRFGLRGIAVTGLAMDHDRVRSRAAGFTFHLKKPVVVRDLEAAIHAILRESTGVVS
jgi:CheY-like chemotaxis protein/CBS domain-containing protein